MSPQTELELLGERLRNTRDYLSMSQQYVSDMTGIPRSAISDIERGTRRVDSLELKKLARLYTRPVSYFLDKEEEVDLGEHALAGLPRALVGLTDGDWEEVLSFAEFLKFRRASEQEQAAERDQTVLASGPERDQEGGE
ncbi:Helix-turn-helix [Streptomyces sp. TLI_053]|uniref:helix-turn-helix domain-containing protein n=1 Tax=Streptomyces sp. TLI_053 TaxID=1855352 RepID=UPI00087A9379|nr:helix-turn-helix transcriptional regulator [Streptomyces sp. TLI_053]SDS47788.1 Helix-turn-helix [Streptomyces sp. TLI_053]